MVGIEAKKERGRGLEREGMRLRKAEVRGAQVKADALGKLR